MTVYEFYQELRRLMEQGHATKPLIISLEEDVEDVSISTNPYSVEITGYSEE